VSIEQEDEIPPAGWEAPEAEGGQPEPDPLLKLAQDLLGVVPEELRLHLAEALRALIEALRALVDWLLARLERTAQPAPKVRVVPIL